MALRFLSTTRFLLRSSTCSIASSLCHNSKSMFTSANIVLKRNPIRILSVRYKHEQNNENSEPNKTVLSETGNYFTSSSEFEDKKLGPNETLLTERDIIKEPPRERFGIIKAVLIIIAGIYFGAWIAMVGAYLLEELEIFVNDDDDDD